MTQSAELALLVVPPMPLATGQLLLAEDDGRPMRISTVALVMTTDEGAEARVALQEWHGAWWPPTGRGHVDV